MSKPNAPAPATPASPAAKPATPATAAAPSPAAADGKTKPAGIDEKGDRLSLAGNSSVQKMLQKLGTTWHGARSGAYQCTRVIFVI